MDSLINISKMDVLYSYPLDNLKPCKLWISILKCELYVYTLCECEVGPHTACCTTIKEDRGILKGTGSERWQIWESMAHSSSASIHHPACPHLCPPFPSSQRLHSLSLHCQKPKWGTNRPFSVSGQGDELGARTPDFPSPPIPMETKLCRRRYIRESNK